MKLIDEIAEMAVPVFVLTGGDPLKRPDIFEIDHFRLRIELVVLRFEEDCRGVELHPVT